MTKLNVLMDQGRVSKLYHQNFNKKKIKNDTFSDTKSKIQGLNYKHKMRMSIFGLKAI